MKKTLFTLFCLCLIISAKSQNVFGFGYYTNEKDSFVVTNVYKNSPADKCGLKVGDFLNFINDIPLSFKSKADVAKVLSEAPISGNELRFYRAPDVKSTIIGKAPLSSFEYICISGNCTSGNCIIESTYGYTIKGTCTNSVVSGPAECYNTDGSLYYKGNMLNNKFDGSGIQYSANKTRFEGDFKNGLRHGSGKIIYPDNNYLIGTWKNDNIEGNAEIYDGNGRLVANRIYLNGKLQQETKADMVASNMPASTSSQPAAQPPIVKTEKKITRDPAINKAIREKMYYIYSNSRERFFSDKMIMAPQFEKVPFDKNDIKKMSRYTYTTEKECDYILEQCKLENYPAFYQNNNNLEDILNGPFRNLKGDEVMSFKLDVSKNGFQQYNEYSILFISTENNKHAPDELLADDGYGFFICVNNATLSDKPSEKYVYTPFTLDNYRKDRGFKNWADKKRAYLVDMDYIYEKFTIDSYGSGDIKEELNISESELQQLKEWCNISNAPEGLNTLTKVKDAHRNAKLIDAVAYHIYKGLYYMPTNENRHLEYAYQPKNSDGWYFCTSPSIINFNPIPESYRQSKLATTDAAMAQYRIEQASREEKMKQDAIKKAEWAAKNEFKGVIIYQFEEWDEFQKKQDYSYKVVSIFGPPNQSLLKEDKIEIDRKVGANITKEVAAPFKEGMDESQAIDYINAKTEAHRFAVNTNFSYTIPERISGNDASPLKELDAAIEKNQQERDRLYKEMMEDNSDKKIQEAQQAMMEVFTGTSKEIDRNTTVEVIEVDKSDTNYNKVKNYIGQKGETKTALKPNPDGSYSGMIEFFSDFSTISFEKVKVKIVP